MHWASSGGHVNILSFCLEQGTNPDVLDEARWTPLIIASSAGHENCVHLLLGMTFFLKLFFFTGKSLSEAFILFIN